MFGSQLTRFELALLAFVRLGLNILMKFGLSAHPGSFEPKVRSYLVQTSNSSQPDQTNQKFKINWIDLGQATQKAHKILAKLNPVKKNNLTDSGPSPPIEWASPQAELDRNFKFWP